MHFIYRTLRLLPTAAPACTPLDCISHVLDEPILKSVPVVDASGVPYATDLELQYGAYALVIAYMVITYVRSELIKGFLKRKNKK